MTKEARTYNGEKTAPSISGAGKTGQPHGKEWIKGLDIRPDTIKLLEENIGQTLSDINNSNIFSDPLPRVMTIKTKINK